MQSTIVIAIVGGAPKKSVELAGEATVGKLRQQLEAGNKLASVNGDPAEDDQALADGDIVTFTEQVKGA